MAGFGDLHLRFFVKENVASLLKLQRPLADYIAFLAKPILTVLVLAIASLLGQMAAQALENRSPPTLPDIPTGQAVATVEAEDNLLFGQPKRVVPPPPPPKPVQAQVTRTKLNLKLVGLIGSGEKGVALFKQRNKVAVVSIGEEVQTGVVLLSVFANGVLLDNRGKQEKLLMTEDNKALATRVTSEPEKPKSAPKLSSRMQSKLDQIGEKLRKAPMTISRYIRFQPLNEGGQWVGVKLWSKKDKSLYRALGLAEGDILREVNGKTIQQMSADPKQWQAFLKKSQFELVVDRKGVLETVSVNFNNLN